MTDHQGVVDDDLDTEREPMIPADEAEFRRLFSLLPVERQHRMFMGFFIANGGTIH